jgi:hypothetical protein
MLRGSFVYGRLRRQLLALASTIQLFSLARSAAAFDLHWSAPVQCPSAERVRERLQERASGEGPRVTAWVDVERAEGEFRARIRTDVDGRQGQRELVADDCAELVAATEVVLSLLLQEGPEALEPEPAAPDLPTEPVPEPATLASPPGSNAALEEATPVPERDEKVPPVALPASALEWTARGALSATA